MSTRCQIGFYPKQDTKLENFDALLYRHSDGYPGKANGTEYGVLADIVPFLQWFGRARGISDSEYCSARLLQWLCDNYDGRAKDRNHTPSYSPDEEFTGTLGHGICKDFHPDIEYFYKIYPGGLQVIQPCFSDYDSGCVPEWDKWKVIKTIKIS